MTQLTESGKAQADPWAEKQPHCIVFPTDAPLGGLLRDLVGSFMSIDQQADLPERFAVIVDCMHSSSNIALARATYPGRPLVAVVARTNAVEVVEALEANADGVICLTEPAPRWRDCLNVVLGGGRWVDGPGIEVRLQHKYTSYTVTKAANHEGDVTLRTRSFVSRSVDDKLFG